MFFTTTAATPRSGVVVMPLPSASCAALAAFAAFAATMSPGVAVVTGRAGRATGGGESVDSLPPTRGWSPDCGAVAILAERVGVSGPLATGGAAGAGAAARALVGGGGGGGLDGRVELVMVDAVFFCGAGVALAGDTVAVAAGEVAVAVRSGVLLAAAAVDAFAEVPPLPAGSALA